MLYGTREWRDYRLAADVTPHLARRVGIALVLDEGRSETTAVEVNPG